MGSMHEVIWEMNFSPEVGFSLQRVPLLKRRFLLLKNRMRVPKGSRIVSLCHHLFGCKVAVFFQGGNRLPRYKKTFNNFSKLVDVLACSSSFATLSFGLGVIFLSRF